MNVKMTLKMNAYWEEPYEGTLFIKKVDSETSCNFTHKILVNHKKFSLFIHNQIAIPVKLRIEPDNLKF